MKSLIALREKIRNLYADYSLYITPVAKFALAILLYVSINSRLGYMEALNNLFILIVLAAISAIIPLNGIAVIGMLLIVVHCFGLGAEVGAVALILYLILILIYFRFVPNDALALLLTPFACSLGVPAAVPLCMGLMRGPASAISSVCGVVSWQFVMAVSDTIAPMKSKADVSPIDILQEMPGAVFENNRFILYAVAFAATALTVSLICRYLTTYTRETAILSGSAAFLVIMIAGSVILDVDISIPGTIIGTILSAAIAFFMDLFVYTVNYKKSRYIQFEDDQYYYYVKAIPKIGPSTGESSEEETGTDGSSEADAFELYGDIDAKDFDSSRIESGLEDSLKKLQAGGAKGRPAGRGNSGKPS